MSLTNREIFSSAASLHYFKWNHAQFIVLYGLFDRCNLTVCWMFYCRNYLAWILWMHNNKEYITINCQQMLVSWLSPTSRIWWTTRTRAEFEMIAMHSTTDITHFLHWIMTDIYLVTFSWNTGRLTNLLNISDPNFIAYVQSFFSHYPTRQIKQQFLSYVAYCLCYGLSLGLYRC